MVQVDRKPGVGLGDPAVALQGVARDSGMGLARQVRRTEAIEHLEAWGDPGLEGKPTQQLLAKGVKGLDAQAPRRLQGLGEKRPGLRERIGLIGGGGAALQRAKGSAEILVRHHRPVAQEPEQPVLHLRRRGPGVGHAEDLVGLGPGQKQAGDPVDQGLGLARARIGGDEGRQEGVGGEGLGVVDLGGGHVSSPSPMEDHSRTRAK